MKYKKGLSGCIIARNEEAVLKSCLASVIDIADEIILVDTGSIDKTKEIASQFKCRIYDFKWTDDFSAARNFALSKAEYEIILSIDADEILISQDKLKLLVANPQPDTGGWLVQLESYFSETADKKNKYVSNLLRIFRNHDTIRYQGIIHEQIHEPITALGLKITNTNIKIDHSGYDYNSQKMAEKQNRNLNLLNKVLDEKPDDNYSLMQRAKTLLALEKFDDAERDFAKALKLINPTSLLRIQTLNFASVCAYKNNHKNLAYARAAESFTILPDQSFACFLLGEISFERKDFSESLKYYTLMRQSASNGNINAFIAGDYRIPDEILAYKIGKSSLGLGDFNSASEEFSKGFAYNPLEVSNIVGMANIAYKLGNFSESVALLKKAIEIDPSRTEINTFLAQAESALLIKQGKSPITPVIKQVYDSGKTLSVCMIVKNEESVLSKCLDSIKNIADEIVIVDTGSSDNTIEIAKSYGAMVYKYDWTDDFAAARNESLKHCSRDWILYIDADEVLTSDSQKLLKALINSMPETVGGLILTIESPHAQLTGRTEIHRGGYPRLFRNFGFPNIRFEGRVHEQITPSLLELNKTFVPTDLVIRHEGYNKSTEEMQNKIKRNYAMLLSHVQEEPLNGYAWYQLGQTLGQMQLAKEAEEAIKFAIDCGNLSNSVYASAAATLSQLCGNKKEFAEALKWAEESLKIAPDQIYGLNLKAYALLYLGNYSQAEDYFSKALVLKNKVSGVPKSGFDIDIPLDVILHGLNLAKDKNKSA